LETKEKEMISVLRSKMSLTRAKLVIFQFITKKTKKIMSCDSKKDEITSYIVLRTVTIENLTTLI